MIETKGLRIGNWVSIMGQGAKAVQEISQDGIVYHHFGESCNIDSNSAFIQPIPLTEEILLNKCNGYYDSFISDNDCIIIDCTDDISIGWCGFLFLYIDGAMIRINNANSNYLHQLQNLFFELKGTELEINL
jgi:hypothetical protein